MDYKKHYDKLINRAKSRILEGYSESHHIIPRSISGNDSKENLVYLTPEEHYLAHQLLTKLYPMNRDLIFAAQMMTNCSNGKRSNNKLFGWIKRKMSEARLGENNPVLRPEVQQKLIPTQFKKGGVPWNKGLKQSQVAWNKGKPHSIETKQKLKEAWKKRKLRGDVGPMKGKHHSEEAKEKIRKKTAERAKKKDFHGFKIGYTHSAETREKLSRITKQRIEEGRFGFQIGHKDFRKKGNKK
jgi:hypothetical protein